MIKKPDYSCQKQTTMQPRGFVSIFFKGICSLIRNGNSLRHDAGKTYAKKKKKEKKRRLSFQLCFSLSPGAVLGVGIGSSLETAALR